VGRGFGRELVEWEVGQPAVQRAFFGTVDVTAERREFVVKGSEGASGFTHTPQLRLLHGQHVQHLRQYVSTAERVSELLRVTAPLLRIGANRSDGEVQLWFCAFILHPDPKRNG